MKKLTMIQAMLLLRHPGVRLVKVHTKTGGCEHWITPDTRVDDELAGQIKRHPQIRAGHDGLWPGHDQTWRWSLDG